VPLGPRARHVAAAVVRGVASGDGAALCGQAGRRAAGKTLRQAGGAAPYLR